MGQIQNAVLNTLGSIQQMAQLYKLTDAYAEQQENKAEERAEKATQQKFEDLKKEYDRGQTIEQVKAKIHAEPYSEEENTKYKEFYSRFYDNTYKDDKTRKDALIREKGDVTKLINSYPGNPNDPEYKDLVRKRQWLDNKDFDYLYKGRGGKKKAQKSPQEQADTNENIEKAKNTIKGGNQ